MLDQVGRLKWMLLMVNTLQLVSLSAPFHFVFFFCPVSVTLPISYGGCGDHQITEGETQHMRWIEIHITTSSVCVCVLTVTVTVTVQLRGLLVSPLFFC